MGRKKKEYSFMDEKAPKTGYIQFRLNNKERVELERMRVKLNTSRAEVFRRAMSEYYKKMFLEELEEDSDQ